MKETAFVNLQPFMVTELHLKGNELIIYAIIHGFSLADDQYYTGGLKYLMEWTESKSKSNTIKILKSLVEKDLVEKIDTVVNGVKFCKYRARVVRKTNWGGSDSEQGWFEYRTEGGSKNEPNNKDINTKDNNKDNKRKNTKKESFIPPTLEEVEQYVKEKGLRVSARRFFNFYTDGDWKDTKGNQVLNWKQKLRTWEYRLEDSEPKKEDKPKWTIGTVL